MVLSMDKPRILIDYPISETGEFVGLSVPQLLHDHFAASDQVEAVRPGQAFDAIIVTNGASQYASRNPPFETTLPLPQRLLSRLGLRGLMSREAKYGRLMQPNLYYEERLDSLLRQNPHAKLIIRMDGSYRQLCKLYGYDETVLKIARRADAVVFQTKYNQEMYEKGFESFFGTAPPVHFDKGVIIRNGVDRQVFREDGPREEWAGNIRILHTAATGMPRKGLGTLLEIAYALRDNDDIRFYLVGRQPDDPIHGREIRHFPNVTHIPFTSNREVLARYYRSASLLLYPTIEDCSPNVVLEAMSCGLPVVAADSGGTPELIRKPDISGGVLMNKGNPVYAVRNVVENLPFYRENAIELVKRHHTKEKMGEAFIDLIRSLF